MGIYILKWVHTNTYKNSGERSNLMSSDLSLESDAGNTDNFQSATKPLDHPDWIKLEPSDSNRSRRGGRKRAVHKGIVYGKPVHLGIRKLKKARSHRSVAEEKVGRRCTNMRVLNSYWVGQDAAYKYFEVILVDPAHNAIKRDPRVNWIVSEKHNRRELRGLPSAGKKYRGLRQKGYRAHGIRPSRRSAQKLRFVNKWRRG